MLPEVRILPSCSGWVTNSGNTRLLRFWFARLCHIRTESPGSRSSWMSRWRVFRGVSCSVITASAALFLDLRLILADMAPLFRVPVCFPPIGWGWSCGSGLLAGVMATVSLPSEIVPPGRGRRLLPWPAAGVLGLGKARARRSGALRFPAYPEVRRGIPSGPWR